MLAESRGLGAGVAMEGEMLKVFQPTEVIDLTEPNQLVLMQQQELKPRQVSECLGLWQEGDLVG